MFTGPGKTIVNARCLALACEELNIPHSFIDAHKNFIRIDVGPGYYFANSSTPFNNNSFTKISSDKEFTYKLLSDTVRMPVTLGFYNPQASDEFQRFADGSLDSIADSILVKFTLPVVVKMNSGLQGINVYLCTSRMQIIDALKKIYTRDTKYSDDIALAQEYIPIKKEYRVVVFKREIMLCYEKDISKIIFREALGLPENQGFKATILTDEVMRQRLLEFIEPIYQRIDIEYCGFDIAVGKNDTIYLLEMNSQLGFSHFARDNGDRLIIDMYKKMLKSLLSTETF